MGRLVSAVVFLGVIIFFGSTPAAGSAPRSAVFQTPKELRSRVDFWIDIFTRFGKYQAVVHHRKFPQVRFEVLDFEHLVPTMNAVVLERHMEKEKDEAVKRVRSVLRHLADGDSPHGSYERGIEKAMAFFGKGSRKYREALDDDLVRSQTGIKERYAEAMQRSGRYMSVLEDIFVNDYGLPVELTRLPFVESSFDYKAYSSVGAAGIWQFMPATAKSFGLSVNSVVDDRRDIVSATHAAAKYLRSAYSQLGSWPLALTSYNHGVGGVKKQISRFGTRNIVALIENQREQAFGFASSNFYPEFLAALEVYSNPQKYFPGLRKEAARRIASHRITRPTTVGYISRQLGVSPDTLQEYNYALSSKVWSGAQKIPAGYLLKVPAAMGADLANLSQPEPECFEPTHTGSSTVYGGGSYLVRKGDSLGKIASRHEVTVAALRGANGLRSDVVRLGQKLIIPSAGRSAPSPASVNRVSNAVSEKPHARSIASSGVYIVKRGDTLSSIAAKSRISISQLKAANNLRGSTVMVGQRLNLAPSKGYIASRSQKATQGMKVYKVRSGETLWHIASKFGVRVDDLKRSNNLSSNSIKVGQQLRIPS